MFGKPDKNAPSLSPKKLTEEEQAIHALAHTDGITPAAAADRLRAAKHQPKPDAAIARKAAEEAAGQAPSAPGSATV